MYAYNHVFMHVFSTHDDVMKKVILLTHTSLWNVTLFCTEYQQCSSPGGPLTGEWVLTDVADNTQLGTEERIRNKGI